MNCNLWSSGFYNISRFSVFSEIIKFSHFKNFKTVNFLIWSTFIKINISCHIKTATKEWFEKDDFAILIFQFICSNPLASSILKKNNVHVNLLLYMYMPNKAPHLQQNPWSFNYFGLSFLANHSQTFVLLCCPVAEVF